MSIPDGTHSAWAPRAACLTLAVWQRFPVGEGGRPLGVGVYAVCSPGAFGAFSRRVSLKVVLRWYDPTGKAQQWTVELVVPGAVKFVNLETGAGMAADSNSQGSGITVSGGGDTWHFAPAGGPGYGALRPDYNTNLNLNVPNSSYAIGTPVVLWSWSGGAAKEIWLPQSVSDIQPYPTLSRCVVVPGLTHMSVVPDGGGYAPTHWTGSPDRNPPHKGTHDELERDGIRGSEIRRRHRVL